MPFNSTTYLPNITRVHRVDARVKILLLLAYSVTLFLVNTWAGLGCCVAVFALCALCAKMPFGRTLRQLLPIAIILIITLIVNSFALNIADIPYTSGLGDVSAGALGGVQSIALVGTFGFVPAGFGRGCFYVLRIALLIFASIVLTSTTTSTEMARALESFLSPLAHLGVPVHDAAMIVSIALRFIPVTVDEFQIVRAAQTARGADFDTGGVAVRLKAWQTVLIPLFVGLYRRADDLAVAMDARCYGDAVPTRLDPRRFTVQSTLLLAGGVALCAVLAWLF